MAMLQCLCHCVATVLRVVGVSGVACDVAVGWQVGSDAWHVTCDMAGASKKKMQAHRIEHEASTKNILHCNLTHTPNRPHLFSSSNIIWLAHLVCMTTTINSHIILPTAHFLSSLHSAGILHPLLNSDQIACSAGCPFTLHPAAHHCIQVHVTC